MMRRLILPLGLLLALLGCAGAFAQPTTMNPSDKGPGITLSGGNLTVTDTLGRIYCIAVDMSAKRIWSSDFYNQNWTGSSNTSNPSSNSNGYDISAHGTSTLYPAIGAFNSSGVSYRIDGDASECLTHAGSLSGFVSWNSVAGGTLTWDSAKKNANITLSSSDAIATWSSGAGEGTVMGTTGIALGSSNKVVYQVMRQEQGTAQSHYIGVSLSTFSTADRCGENSSANSSCYYYSGSWYRNGSASGGTATRWDEVAYGRFGRSTTSKSSGKHCFEANIVSISSSTASNTKVNFGIALSTADLTNNSTTQLRSYIGGDTNAYGVGEDGTIFNNAATTGIDIGSVVAGQTYMSCGDFDADKYWVYNPVTAQWNGDIISNQNPATGTGGIAITAGQTWFAAAGVGSHDAGSQVVMNFGATAFSNSRPSGFQAWDPPANTRSRGLIWGANDNFPGWVDDDDRCRVAA